jgi:hypothetical protein
MGVRGVLRDVLTLYVCFVIFNNLLQGKINVDFYFIIALIIVFLLTIWILLEKIGIIPKLPP